MGETDDRKPFWNTLVMARENALGNGRNHIARSFHYSGKQQAFEFRLTEVSHTRINTTNHAEVHNG